MFAFGSGLDGNDAQPLTPLHGTHGRVQIFGKNDNHVPPEGRDLIRKTLHDKGVLFSFYEVAWAQRGFPFPTKARFGWGENG